MISSLNSLFQAYIYYFKHKLAYAFFLLYNITVISINFAFKLLFLIISFVIISPVIVYIRIFNVNNNGVFVGLKNIANNVINVSDSLSALYNSINVFSIRQIYYKEYTINDKINLTEVKENYFRYNPVQALSKSFYFYSVPLELPNLNSILIFTNLLFKNQLYIYVWNNTFLPFYIDFWILKLLKKNIISMHCGDDVRYRRLQNHFESTNNSGLHFPTSEFNLHQFLELIDKLLFVKISSRFTEVISTLDQATLQEISYHQFVFPQPRILNSLNVIHNKIVNIIHAPSDRDIKGTQFVLDAIKILEKTNLSFEFELLENIPNHIVLEKLANADIVIDQPGVHAARLAVEAMSCNCCVIGGNNPNYHNLNSPIIQFKKDSNDLASKLVILLESPKYLENMKLNCYNFWQSYFSNAAFNLFIKDIISGNNTRIKVHKSKKSLYLLKSDSFIEKFLIKFLYQPKSESHFS